MGGPEFINHEGHELARRSDSESSLGELRIDDEVGASRHHGSGPDYCR